MKSIEKGISFMMVMVLMLLVIPPVPIQAATSPVKAVLKPAKTYQYDLDKDGKKEKIKYTVTEKAVTGGGYYNYKYTAQVTINGKSIYKKSITHHTNPFEVIITDVDSKDKQMEILILEGHVNEPEGNPDMWTSDMKNIYYYQYSKGKAIRKQNLATLFKKQFKKVYSIHGIKNKVYFDGNGKGELSAKLCINGKPNFDFLHVKVKLNLVKGKFVVSKTNTYNLLDKDKYYYFRPTKNITVYKKPGRKDKAYTIKKGQRIYPSELYVMKSGKIYLHIKDKAGRKGYIDPQKVKTYDDGTFHVGA